MSQFFKTYKETKDWLDLMNIKNYTINSDLTVDVNDGVDISDRDLTFIPVKFNVVRGTFNCSYNKLTTLIGSPYKIGNKFICNANPFKSLIGSPKEIDNGFYCYSNCLTSLEGLSIINIMNNSIYKIWFLVLDIKIKEDYFNKNLDQNPELIKFIKKDDSLINYYKKLVRKNKLKIFINDIT